jgi:DNA polymerase-1
MSVLQELARVHELPKELLLWRGLAKLKSTYLDALQRMINPETGRIHTTFNQTATSTGRLSSSEPNLQNIPIKGEWGERIRRVFIADRGHVLLSADYSQIELRILAHLSNDEKMRRAFIEERDIHSETAMELFSLQENELTQDIRRLAKTVNFGIVYGISPFGLSEATGTSIEDARQFIERYFETYPGVKAYADRIIEEAKRLGYVRTLFGRKRHIPELHSPVASERSLGERLAINTPVQGTAADIIKMAMINIYRRIRSEGLRSGLVLQIHDELLFEVHEEELSYVKEMVKEEMESVVKLSVPLKVEIGTGKNWAEAHS